MRRDKGIVWWSKASSMARQALGRGFWNLVSFGVVLCL